MVNSVIWQAQQEPKQNKNQNIKETNKNKQTPTTSNQQSKTRKNEPLFAVRCLPAT